MATKQRSAARKSGLTQSIYDGLRDEITSGKLKPGTLLSRRTVAARYGTSYIAVIEAMARLENTGLIEVEARQVARVTRINVETIQDTYVLREAYETQAIRQACGTATDAEIAELYRLADEVDSHRPMQGHDRRADKKGARLHWEFHLRIAEVSRCRSLVTKLHQIELLRRLQANWYYAPEMIDPLRHHSMLVDAIQERNPIRADAVMRAHVRRGLEKELLGYHMENSELEADVLR